MNDDDAPREDVPALREDERWMRVKDFAAHAGTGEGEVRRLLRERRLVAASARDGKPLLPSVFASADGDGVAVRLPGTVTLLLDGGYDDVGALTWLLTDDETLPGRPVDALQGHLAREVRRRAQAER